jgi:ketosteroid isomerase-like protein
MIDFLSNDNSVAAFGRYQATMIQSGVRVNVPVAHFATFRDGKISHFVQLTNSAVMADAIRGRAAAGTA